MRTLGLMLLCFSGSLVFAQTITNTQAEHAPTIQACQADFNLWSSQISGFPLSTAEQDQEGTKSLTVAEIANRLSYLDDCSLAYPVLNKNRPREFSALFSFEWVYAQEIIRRKNPFLSRHGLSAKFYEEDESGKR